MADSFDTLTDDVMQDLYLDQTPENKAVVDALVKDSREIIADSVNSSLSASKFEADRIYLRAVKALAEEFFRDRELSNGMPSGIQLMITHLKGRYAEWPKDKAD